MKAHKTKAHKTRVHEIKVSGKGFRALRNIRLVVVYGVVSDVLSLSRVWVLGLLILASVSAPVVWAEEAESEASVSVESADGEVDADKGAEGAVAAKPIYIPLKPPFVVNYGGPGRLKYLKTELSVRVDSAKAARALRHHMPLIRNSLVLLFSRQTDADLNTLEGKELLRQNALTEIRVLLENEEGSSGVVDLYFNNLIIQK